METLAPVSIASRLATDRPGAGAAAVVEYVP